VRRLADHADIVVAALLCSALAVILWSQGGQDNATSPTGGPSPGRARTDPQLQRAALETKLVAFVGPVLALVYRLTLLSIARGRVLCLAGRWRGDHAVGGAGRAGAWA